MKIATLTPTRGTERATLLQFCREQIDSQTVQPDNKYFIAFEPENGKKDITKRVRHGFELAQKDGVDWIVIHEDDDAYQVDHIEKYSRYFHTHDFIGDPVSIYYNIRTHRWDKTTHHGRASLYTTAFRVSAMAKFKWPPDDHVFLDINIWRYAKQFRCKFITSGAVGIKHSIGLTGGKGHRMKLRHDDSDLGFLRSRVSFKQFEFYNQLTEPQII